MPIVLDGTSGITTPSLTNTGVETISGVTTIQGVTVGRGAGAVVTNTAVGASALAANTTGSGTTAFGYQALNLNTTGTGTAFGYVALAKATTADGNTAFGSLSLYNTTTGSYNVAVGLQALQNNTTASNSTAVGYQAGYTNQTGAYNTFLGRQAGYTSNVSGNGVNTCVGDTAGYALTTGTYNTFVGPTNSGGLITTGGKNTIIGGYTGNQGGLDIRTASNYIVLSDGDGNPRGYANSGGIWSFTNGVRSVSLTLSNTSTGTITVPSGCVCTMSSDGYLDECLMFSLKANGGGQGCYIMARAGSASAWGIGTTSNPGTGTRGNLWVSGTNTLSIQNLSGSLQTFYLTFLSAV